MKKSKKGFWIFICPALFAFIVVQIIPTIMGIGYSFTDWNESERQRILWVWVII